MTRSQVAGFALAVLATLPLPQTADAQLGGLIKKKVTEAITPTAKPATGQPQAEQPAGGARAGSDERVLEITEENFAGLLRGLEAEQQMRAEFKKELARYPTAEAYGMCMSSAMTSPEAMRIMAANAAPKNASVDDVQRAMVKMSTEQAAHLQKMCPLDPSVWNDRSKRWQLERFRMKAAEIAFPSKPTSSSPNTLNREGVFHLASLDAGNLLFETALSDNATGAVADTIVSLNDPNAMKKLNLEQYARMIERVAAYCDHVFLNPDDQGTVDGLKFPGEGKDIYWVYTGNEIRLLAGVNCPVFTKKWEDLLNW